MYDATFQERRLTRRAPVRSSVLLLEEACVVGETRVLNLSVGGALLHGRCPFGAGTALRISLRLPHDTLRLCAHVVRVERSFQERFAIQFDWLTPVEEDAIHAAVQAALRPRARSHAEVLSLGSSAKLDSAVLR